MSSAGEGHERCSISAAAWAGIPSFWQAKASRFPVWTPQRRVLDDAEAWAQRKNLIVDLRLDHMTALPYADVSFDAVVAWNVVCHGEPLLVELALKEIRRVLRPGGLYLGRFLSKRHLRYGRGREIARDTFVIDDAEEHDHPHYFCDEQGALA